MIYVLLDQQLKLKWKLCIEQRKGKIGGGGRIKIPPVGKCFSLAIWSIIKNL